MKTCSSTLFRTMTIATVLCQLRGLVDLQNDPDETRNLVEKPEHQATVTRLKAELARLRKELGDEND